MTALQATQSASETVPCFAEEPVPVFDYFQNAVRRILQDNLESATILALESTVVLDTKHENVELLSLVDAHPVPGDRIQYHDVYELSTPRDPRTRTADTIFAINLSKVPWEAPEGPHSELRPARKNSNRSYTASEKDGIIVVEHRDMSFGHPTVRNTLEGMVEDPRALGDPLDSPAIALLKRDIERVKISTPAKTLGRRRYAAK